MARKNGFRVLLLFVVGGATLICLVFSGLLIRLAVRTYSTSEEQVAARKEKQEKINEQFEEAFGQAGSEQGNGFGDIQIDFGNLPAPSTGGGDPAPAGSSEPVAVDSPPTPVSSPPEDGEATSDSLTITIDIDASGNASYEGQALTEESLKQFLSSLGGEGNIVLDVHPSCDQEEAGVWWLVCSEAGYTAITQRETAVPR